MRAAHRLSRIASPKFVLPLAWMTALAMRRREGAARLALGTTLAVGAEELLKRLVWRHRPKLLCRAPWRSFPSGHSASSSAYLLGLALMAPRHARGVALAAAAAGAAAVNVSRVLARDHWPSDVLAGDVVAALAVAAAGAVHLPHDEGPRQ